MHEVVTRFVGLDELVANAREYPKAFQRARHRVLERFGKDVRDELAGRITEQRFPGLAALNPAWVQRKIKAGWSTNILVATGDYAKGLVHLVTPKGVRVVPTGVDKRTGTPYGIIAKWLEQGTWRMPARPHWMPTMAWAKNELRARTADMIQDVLNDILRTTRR